MQVKSKDGTIRKLSGRIDEFVFRTYPNGKISAFYKPRHSRLNPEALSNRFREIIDALNLEIIEHERETI